MQTESATTRALSASIFGNEKMIEVVLALAEQGVPTTQQQLSTAINLQYTMVRDVLVRLERGGVLRCTRTGGSRSALYYEPANLLVWDDLVSLASAVRASVVNSQ